MQEKLAPNGYDTLDSYISWTSKNNLFNLLCSFSWLLTIDESNQEGFCDQATQREYIGSRRAAALKNPDD